MTKRVDCCLLLVVCALATSVGVGDAQIVEPAALRPRAPVGVAPDTSSRDTSAKVRQQGSVRVRRAPNCFRAQPAPLCRVFMLSEFAFESPFASTRRTDPLGVDTRDFRNRALWSMGAMRNVGRDSYGGVAAVAYEEATPGYMPWTIEARYKRWLTPRFTVDAGVGYKHRQVWSETAQALVPARGVTAMAGVMPTRYVGVSVRADVLSGGGRTAHGVSLGVRSQWLAEQFVRFTALAATRRVFAIPDLEVNDSAP